MKKHYLLLVSILLLTYGFANAQPTQPADPAAGNSSNCTTNAAIMTCPANSSGVQTSFTGGVYNRGNSSDHLGVGAIWRFTNITTVTGTQVNAEVRIDAASNATLQNSGTGSNTSSTALIEDDAAVNQSNVSIASFFAPRISPNASGNGSTRGYVQFTISFFNNTSGGFTNSQNLQNLNFVHLDNDGNGNSSAWFRETGVALASSATNPAIIANGSTELISYSYTDNTTTPGGSWRGYAGSVFERDGVSTCAEVAEAYRYTGNKSSITFRMGYDYKGTGNPGTTARQYGATFGCFAFPAEISLPVKLTSFSGVYRNQQTLLNWTSESEQNFDRYEIERSSNAVDFQLVGTRSAAGSSVSKANYSFNDDLSLVSGNVFYYRLKMIDIDLKAEYSNVIMIRKDAKAVNGISMTPNPVVNGMANIRLTSSAAGSIEFKVTDMSGRVLLRQQDKVYEGNNSITVNNLDRLQAGIYTLQMFDGEAIVATKFSIVR